MPVPSNPALLAFIALTMAEGYTKTQANVAWTNLTGASAGAEASALWDQVQAALDAVDNEYLSASGTLCPQCGRRVLLSAGVFRHHLRGSGGPRREPCLSSGLTPAQAG